MSVKARFGWGPFFEQQMPLVEAQGGRLEDLAFARVVEEQRGAYRVAGDFDGLAEISGRFRHQAQSPADFPAVGDWVGVGVSGRVDVGVQGSVGAGAGDQSPVHVASAQRAIIHHRLARRSTISRAAPGRAVQEQVIAANVDTILVVTTATADLNARRLERYLTIVWNAGATPVVIINKADLVADASAIVEALGQRLPFVDIVAISAMRAGTRDTLARYMQPAQTVALVGSSGVGKSTLVNCLLGHDALKVAAVREWNGRGRHTTTARQLIVLPSGALLIDTPGMRELLPWVETAALDTTFNDVATLAESCRFRDCAHKSEPDCAVRAAVADGALDPGRLQSYHRLVREAEFEERKRDKAAAAEAKRRWRQTGQALKTMYRDRERL